MPRLVPWLALIAVLVALGGGVYWWAEQRGGAEVRRIAALDADQRPADPRDRALLAARIAAAERDPGNPERWNALGDALFAIEAFAQAEKAYARSLEIDDSQGVVWSLMGEARVRQGSQRDVVSMIAVHAFEQALRLDPNDLRARFYLAMADYNAGRRGRGIAAMRELMARSVPGSIPFIAARETLKEWGVGPSGAARDPAARRE